MYISPITHQIFCFKFVRGCLMFEFERWLQLTNWSNYYDDSSNLLSLVVNEIWLMIICNLLKVGVWVLVIEIVLVGSVRKQFWLATKLFLYCDTMCTNRYSFICNHSHHGLCYIQQWRSQDVFEGFVYLKTKTLKSGDVFYECGMRRNTIQFNASPHTCCWYVVRP